MQDGSLPLNMILDQVSRDKGIDKEVLVEAVEAAILTAAKRTFGTWPSEVAGASLFIKSRVWPARSMMDMPSPLDRTGSRGRMMVSSFRISSRFA